uniref:Uncharacterized protein n=1 Tax=White spot syndrome virus TaxID=342409 RepID=A0A6B9MPB7_9VIRU|nr:hypothetical protein [White spot syndrome virus]WOG35196.1 wsv062 [White spot syndrome virus]
MCRQYACVPSPTRFSPSFSIQKLLKNFLSSLQFRGWTAGSA